MINLAILFVANCQQRHFHRNNTTFAVILQHFIADVLRSHQLTHKSIILNVNIIDNAIHLIRIAEGSAHKFPEGGYGKLRNAAARGKTRRSCTQQTSDFDLCHSASVISMDSSTLSYQNHFIRWKARTPRPVKYSVVLICLLSKLSPILCWIENPLPH